MSLQQPTIPPDAVAALSDGRKVEAIKIIRAATGLGLKESKDAAEAFLAANPAVMEGYKAKTAFTGGGMMIVVLILALVAFLVYQFV